ncbi:YrvL family regulatory protein [Oceanobacillus manasiensis]|uniref:YrvL family regulatory protein n=1 Tax=Oceanobacillus manasiensis TaxID=586413 RepID=UPI0005AA6A73|nr:YrvL family regulatory protein [Oceanobacillus manasiensis]
MSKNKDNEDEELGIIGKVIVGLLLGLLVVFCAAVFIAIYLFAFAGLFTILDIAYPSLKSLVFFNLWFFGVAIIFELIFIGIFYRVSASIGRYSRSLYILFDCISTWLAIFTVDELFTTITITVPQEIIIAVVFSLIEFAFENKKEGKDA